MKFHKKIVALVVVCLVVFSSVLPTAVYASASGVIGSEAKEHIASELRSARIPNAAIAIIQDNEVSYILKDSTEDTLFQIGSVSKSFTGFGVLLLEEKGLLSVNDPINKHMPWFEVNYQGAPVPHEDITISNLLQHTSGFTSDERHFPSSIGGLTEDEFISQVIGSELAFYPSERHVYGNINYIILGLLIEAVSGQSYDEFMTHNVLHPLGLYHTFTNPQHAYATGHVIGGNSLGFFRAWSRDVPVDILTVPTGYIYSNITDMTRWAGIHLGRIDVGEQFTRIVEQSHLYNSSSGSPFSDGWGYGAGWVVVEESGMVGHNGQTPGYSATVRMYPYRDTAVIALANLNLIEMDHVSTFVLNTVEEGRTVHTLQTDFFVFVDIAYIIATVIGMVYVSLFVWLGVRVTKKIRSDKEAKRKINFKVSWLIDLIISVAILMGFYIIPSILMHNSHGFLVHFGPISGFSATIAMWIMTVYSLCSLLAKMFVLPPKKALTKRED